MDTTAGRGLVTAIAVAAVATLVATTVLGTAGPGGGAATTPSILGAPDGSVLAAGLETAQSCEEFGTRMATLARESGYGLDGGVMRGFATADAAEEMDDSAGGGDGEASRVAAGDSAAPGETQDSTNVQVEGVDEPDVVERVGDLTVVGTQGVLRVVTLDGAGAPVARGQLPVGAWSELELLGIGDDRVVAIVRDGLPTPLRGIDAGDERSLVVPAWSSTSVVLIDLADPDAPAELSRVDLEGWLVDARAVDGVVRLAVRGDGPQIDLSAAGPFAADRDIDWETATREEQLAYDQAWQAEYEQRMAQGLGQVAATDWQPHARVTGADGTSRVVPLVSCERIGFPIAFAGLGTLTVATLDATGDLLRIDDATSVVTAGEQLYSTADRVVIATTRWEPCCIEEPQLEEEPAPEVDPFFEEDEGAAAGATATASARAMIDRAIVIEPGFWGRGSSTDLHVFDVDGTLVDHVASGSVDGWLLNQFSMSIDDGVLRVATTSSDDAGRTSSAVTTFRVEGTDLVRLGSIGDLGPDEEIQAVRFMGDVAYVVTFRRTDPLYVVDLADPAAPRTLGELKIEGYSAYLHPLGEGRLLGVGQDADPATGATRGVQVSTFDVTDPRSPTRIDVDVTPNSSSEVEWDHHALTVTGDGTVFVPFEQWDARADGEPRLGVLVYEVAADGSLVEVGVLDSGSRWELRPRRTLDLGDVLLTVGEQGVTSWDAASFVPLGTVTFPAPDWDALEQRVEQGLD